MTAEAGVMKWKLSAEHQGLTTLPGESQYRISFGINRYISSILPTDKISVTISILGLRSFYG
tara:strand:- start:292 stop:477 length:186 start_codon:yes stop_codon:yes gene_type:complete